MIAFRYLRPWDLEKVFDELKRKLGAKRAWANSAVAQQMRAHFPCLAHNLIRLCERPLAAEYQITNVAEQKRRVPRLAAPPRLANARKAVLSALVQTHSTSRRRA